MERLFEKVTGRSCRKARLSYEESVTTLRTTVENLWESTQRTHNPQAASRALQSLREARELHDEVTKKDVQVRKD